MFRVADTHLVLNEISDQIMSILARDHRRLQQYVVADYRESGVRGVSGIVLDTPSGILAVRVAMLDESYRSRFPAKDLVEKNDLPVVVDLDDDLAFDDH
jgi:hypothetical protein